MKPTLTQAWSVILRLVWGGYKRGYLERKDRVEGVQKEMSASKKVEGKNQPSDRRLTKGGIWQRLLPPNEKVRVLKVGVPGKGAFKGDQVVRLMPLEGGKPVNYREEDFLTLFQPILSAVRGD